MKLKQTSLLLLAIGLTATACKTDNNNIQGNFSGAGNDSLVVIQRIPGSRVSTNDTIAMTNGKFSVNLPDTALSFVSIIELPKEGKPVRMTNMSNSIVLLPGNKLKVSGKPDSIHVTGSEFYTEYNRLSSLDSIKRASQGIVKEYNQLYSQGLMTDSIAGMLQQKVDELNERQKNIEIDYIKNNPDSDVSAYLFSTGSLAVVAATDSVIGEKAKSGPFKDMIDTAIKRNEKAKKIAEAQAKLQPGSKAPEFVLKDLQGKEVSLVQFKGKYVVLDFWGSWCSWCIKGIPEMKNYYSKYNKKMEIIGIDCRDTEDKWRKAVAEYELPWVNLYSGDNTTVSDLYAVSGFPTKVIIDPQGNIVKTIVGESPEFYSLLDSLLGAKKK